MGYLTDRNTVGIAGNSGAMTGAVTLTDPAGSIPMIVGLLRVMVRVRIINFNFGDVLETFLAKISYYSDDYDIPEPEEMKPLEKEEEKVEEEEPKEEEEEQQEEQQQEEQQQTLV